VTLGPQPMSVMGFTVTDGKIDEIDVIADPDRLAALTWLASRTEVAGRRARNRR
jgi:hypothetical protein